MAAPDWVSYTGIGIGSFGTVLAFISCYVAYLAYKRADLTKSLDLRISCKKDLVELDEHFRTLQAVYSEALKSRPRILSALGRYNSGDKVIWDEQTKCDLETIEHIDERRHTIPSEIDATIPERLELLLVNIHELKIRTISLNNKYEKELKTDKDESARLAEAANQRHIK